MALGKQMKVRPADLLGHLWGLLYCKWQRPRVPFPSSSVLVSCTQHILLLHCQLNQKRGIPIRGLSPQPAGTLTSSNDLQLGLSLFSSSTQSQQNLQHMPHACTITCPAMLDYDLNQTASARTGWSSPQECALIQVHPQG